MRNLKKILALVLVLVMAMSFASAASFSDVENNDAIDVLTGIGVINGYEDGTFKPEGTLTREQAAKIIAYLELTAPIAETLPTDGGIFTDVASGHWSAGYIAYAYTTGIVNGNGDGTFSPAGELTGYAFAKMILNVLDIEGDYTGLLWKVGVANALAETEKGALLNGIEKIDLNAPMTRAQACQMAYNALWVGAKTTETTHYTVSAVEGGSYASYIALLDGVKYESQIDAVKAVKDLCNAVLGRDFSVVKTTKETASTSELSKLHGVKTYERADCWGIVTTGVETIADTDKDGVADAIYTANEESYEVYETISKAALHTYFKGTDKTDKTVTYIVDGVEGTLTVNNTDKTGVVGGNGVEVLVCADKVVVINTTLVTVTKVNKAVKAGDETYPDGKAAWVDLSNGMEITTESYKEGDYLLVKCAGGKVQAYADPDCVTGVMTGYKGTKSITLKTADGSETIEWAYNSTIKSITDFENTLKVLTDGTYAYGLDTRVAATPDAAPVDGYAKVLSWQVKYTGADNSTDLIDNETSAASVVAKAKVQFLDGTVAVVDLTTITVEKNKPVALADGIYFVNPVTYGYDDASDESGALVSVSDVQWASYYVLEDGTYTFCAVSGAKVAENVKLNKNKTLVIDGTTYRLNSATKFVEYNSHKDVQAAAEMVGYSKIVGTVATDLLVFANDKNVITEIYGLVNVAPAEESTDVALENYYFALSATEEVNAYGTKWNFVVDGEVVSYYVAATNVVAGELYEELTINDKGVVTVATEAANYSNAGVVSYIDEGVYFEANGVAYEMDADCVVYDYETGAEATLEVDDTAHILTKTVKVNGENVTVVVMIFVEKAEA